VANGSAPEQLSESRYVTLTVRLLVNRDGELVRGEVGGLVANQPTERWVRFRGAGGLLRAVRTWLSSAPFGTQDNSRGRASS
jgi:hypothetical protein